MNKQELIEQIEGLKNLFGNKSEYIEIDMVIRLISELDEPQKVVVEKFVADWYEKHKDYLEYDIWEYILHWGKQQKSEFYEWMNHANNKPFQTLANMHQFGYTVEKEKRYTVKMRTTKQPLFYNSLEKRLFFSLGGLATQFTRKELEDAGFGEVFGNPLFEVEEVEE